MTTLLNLTFGSTRASEKADARLTATLIARAIAEDRTTHDDEGQLQIQGRTYFWERQLDAGAVPSAGVLLLKRISVRVSWDDGADDRGITYKTATWEAADAR